MSLAACLILLFSPKLSCLLYSFLKLVARLAIRIYCRKIEVNKPELLHAKGPLLLACNHPNSFLDGIILATLFQQPVYSLARGDVFKKNWSRRLLARVNLLPVYRSSEGNENLSENYTTFTACRDIFKKQGIVIIFSEGRCINEWHLRPLRKGTARLAVTSWEQNIPLQVLPTGINYSSFRRFGKNLLINFGTPIDHSSLEKLSTDGSRYLRFNQRLQDELKDLVLEIAPTDQQRQQQLLQRSPSIMRRILLALPAAIGWLLHAPLYWPVKKFTYYRTHNNDHFDSVVVAILFFLYPLYLLLITIAVALAIHSWLSLLCLLILPFTAWAFVQIKPQLDRQR